MLGLIMWSSSCIIHYECGHSPSESTKSYSLAPRKKSKPLSTITLYDYNLMGLIKYYTV